MENPIPIILVGAIGGLIFKGIIGFFEGAVVLALSHKLFLTGLNNETVQSQVENGGESPFAKDPK